MTPKPRKASILDLHDLEGKRTFAAMLILVGLIAVAYGVGQLLKTTDTAMDQVSELTERVEHLAQPPVISPSEPAKT